MILPAGVLNWNIIKAIVIPLSLCAQHISLTHIPHTYPSHISLTHIPHTSSLYTYIHVHILEGPTKVISARAVVEGKSFPQTRMCALSENWIKCLCCHQIHSYISLRVTTLYTPLYTSLYASAHMGGEGDTEQCLYHTPQRQCEWSWWTGWVL
jgi:hypothetical protein